MALAKSGWAVLCLDLAQAAGDAALPAELAEALIEGALQPPGLAAPQARWVLGGFSAGAVLAARVGMALEALAPARLEGLLLLDPVDAPGFGVAIERVSNGGGRPVLAVLANPGPCNAQGSAAGPLRAMAERASNGHAATEVVQLVRGSTHVDAEGEDTGELAVALCRQGPPQARNVAALREIAAAWLATVDDPRRRDGLQALVVALERSGEALRLGRAASPDG
ncbi:MAG: alpha/beta hydrolase [Ideonella sp.]|nr:alpha/beta hydrolase [Ideonella sp.]